MDLYLYYYLNRFVEKNSKVSQLTSKVNRFMFEPKFVTPNPLSNSAEIAMASISKVHNLWKTRYY